MNGEQVEGEPFESRILSGFAYEWSEQLKTDVAVSAGVTEESPDFGITYLF